MAAGPFELVTLTQGGQQAQDIAARLEAFLGAAERTLDLALYDVRLPGPVGDRIAGALRGASERGVRVRVAIQGPDAHPDGHTSAPPQTRSVLPGMPWAPGLARKVRAWATSSGRPPWPSAERRRPASRIRSGMAAVMRVSMKPGAMALAVMPRGASWVASAST